MEKSIKGPAQRDGNRQWYLFLAVLFILTLARIPFIMTNHVQEDAYIHWQIARNVVQTGVFGFKPGERVYGSTSPLYVLVSSVFYFLLGNSAPAEIILFNVLVFNLGILIISHALVGDNRKLLFLSVFAISFLPVSLVTSYSGMETPILVLLLALLLYSYSARRSLPAYIALVILPWVRLDSIVFVSLYFLFVLLRDRRLSIYPILAYLISLALLLGVGWAYFGSPWPQTILGKASTYGVGSRSLPSRLAGVLDGFKATFLLINTKYLEWSWLATMLAILLTFGVAIWRNVDKRHLTGLILAFVLFPSLIYGATTHVFEWYLAPSAVLAYSVFVTVAFKQLVGAKRKLGIAIVMGGTLLALAQLALAINTGTQEYQYRRSVGIWIKEHSDSGASILLEPIGYIGYFGERYIRDEVGLVTPSVVDYRQRYGLTWWGKYVRDFRPTFLVERSDFPDRHGSQGGTSSDEDWRYFSDNYTLAKTFHYDPASLATGDWVRAITRLGSAEDYLVYVRSDHIPPIGYTEDR